MALRTWLENYFMDGLNVAELPAGTTTGDLLYIDASGNLAKVAGTKTDGFVVTLSAGIPTWLAAAVAAPVAFDPTTVATLLAWYSADALVTTSGSNVTNVGNRGGAVDAAKALVKAGTGNIVFNAADSTFNSKATMSFSNGPRLEGSGAWASAPAQPVTIYCVAKGTANILYDGNSSRSRMLFSGSHFTVYAGSTLTDASATLSSAAHCSCTVFNGSSSAIYVHDATTALLTGNPGTQANSQLVIGDVAGGGQALIGTFAEILMYSGAHNATDRGSIMGYLNTKYGT